MILVLKISNSKKEVYTRFLPDVGAADNIRMFNRHYIERFLRQDNVRELVEDCIHNKESAILTWENEINGKVVA